MNPAPAAAVRTALTEAVACGDLAVRIPDSIAVHRSRSLEPGDFATPVALTLAGEAGLSPLAVADILARRLRTTAGISEVDISGPGFVNIRLEAAAAGTAAAVIGAVLAAGAGYGASEAAIGGTIEINPGDQGLRSVPTADARRRIDTAVLGRITSTQKPAARSESGVESRLSADWKLRVDSPVNSVSSAHAGATRESGPVVLIWNRRAQPGTAGSNRVTVFGELVDAIGVDAARFALLRFPLRAGIELEVRVWAAQTCASPVYRVRFAHARLAALARWARDIDACAVGGPAVCAEPGQALSDTPAAAALVLLIADYPHILTSAARRRETHPVVRYLEKLSTGVHAYLDTARVLPTGNEPLPTGNEPRTIGNEPPTAGRLAGIALGAAARQVLANGLAVLDVSAPEQL